jgi:hypothetical protein
MRFRPVTIVLVCFAASPVLAAPPTRHIRSLDAAMTKTISDGVARSPTFARIVDGLERSTVIVFIGFNAELPPSAGGRTTFMTSSGKWRYLRIVIRARLSEFQRITMVAHELHHALEIGSRPEVHDRRSLEDLYKAIGVPLLCASECFETGSAIEAANDVARELQHWMFARAQPPAKCCSPVAESW